MTVARFVCVVIMCVFLLFGCKGPGQPRSSEPVRVPEVHVHTLQPNPGSLPSLAPPSGVGVGSPGLTPLPPPPTPITIEPAQPARPMVQPVQPVQPAEPRK
jgi:hypothetical protein